MHLKYEHDLLPFLKYTILNVETAFKKVFLAICFPKTEFLAKSTTFIQLTGNVTGLTWLVICYYFWKYLLDAACKLMQHNLTKVYSKFTSSPSWIIF